MAVRTYNDFWGEDIFGYAPAPAPGDFSNEAMFGYTPSPVTNPYSEKAFKSNRLRGGTDLDKLRAGGSDDFSQYPVYGGDSGGGVSSISGSGYGGSLRYRQPTGSVVTQKTTFTGKMPTLDLTEMDKKRVKALTQKAMAPRLRLLRSALQRALVRSYENPNVRRMIVRSALQGYGQGIESARAGAEKYALTQEASERATKNKELVAAYNAAMENYRRSGVTTTTTKNTYDTSSKETSGNVGLGGGYTSGFGPLGPMNPPQRRSKIGTIV